MKCLQLLLLPKIQPSHNHLGSALHTVTKLPLFTAYFPGLFLPTNSQTNLFFLNKLICEMESKLVTLILIKVYND